MESRENVANIAFYRFVDVAEPADLRSQLHAACVRHQLKGTILIAREGFNGMLAGDRLAVEKFAEELKALPLFEGVLLKWSYSSSVPFKRLLVKVKKEILTDRAAREPRESKATTGATGGLTDRAPTPAPYLKPEELRRALISGEKLVLVDIRNDFEVQFGKFKDALNPGTKSFSQFSRFAHSLELAKDTKIITYCTGGIRCEKGAAHLMSAGFKNVFQLEGGILEYFHRTDGEFFEGSCFVFDDRIALDHRLKPVDGAVMPTGQNAEES